ncbi:MAG: excinuclease ABC subunit UvrB [Kiritimatiellia bacterium]
MSQLFKLVSPFEPMGDQPAAIETIARRYREGARFQTLEGVTGSGKTFTMANVIGKVNKPTLVISHNKTLAAQLYAELKGFFPDNAVEFFISYYDYYQPEAYIPQTDTYIEKDSSINKQIERLRLAATNSLMSREDVVIVASVSCIYGLGSPEDYRDMVVRLERGQNSDREEVLRKLVDIQYARNDYAVEPGTFRCHGDVLDVFPAYHETGFRIVFFGDTVETIAEIEPLTGKVIHAFPVVLISPANHFVMPQDKIERAMVRIRDELDDRIRFFELENKLLEAQRIKQRTLHDLETLKTVGYCSGIENYSRHLSDRKAGDPPATLMHYFRDDFLTIVDESHVTIPQLRAMYNGDQARKNMLIEHGFRLPSARDNRPFNFDEFLNKVNRVLFVSATPGPFEFQMCPEPVQQLIRPTGLLDPPVIVRPLTGQIDDLMEEVKAHAERHERVLVTTLTKKTAEDLTRYLNESGLRVQYLHSDITALDRVQILRHLRRNEFDCLVGVNLLREGLDLPEVALVAVLDADKEGFLRSDTSLIQTAGRAARNVNGKVILYADRITNSMKRMIDVTEKRRIFQLEYNRLNGITPRTVIKEIEETLMIEQKAGKIEENVLREAGESYDVHQVAEDLKREMVQAAESLEFERAGMLRDQLTELMEAAGMDLPATLKKKRAKPFKKSFH